MLLISLTSLKTYSALQKIKSREQRQVTDQRKYLQKTYTQMTAIQNITRIQTTQQNVDKKLELIFGPKILIYFTKEDIQVSNYDILLAVCP